MPELALVIPVYNEEFCIRSVLDEWLAELRKQQLDFSIIVVNDGSKDGTLNILNTAASENADIVVVDKPNSGHGQSCVVGYKTAIERGAVWILQIDSDGQCDSKYFKQFWDARDEVGAVMGARVNRDDGLDRTIISKVLSLVLLVLLNRYIADSNVPYRLMHRKTLSQAVALIPESFYLSNVLLSFIYKKRFRITWIPIGFRERTAGKPKANHKRMMELAVDMMRDCISVRNRI